MEKKDCFFLGKITKPFGFKGELVLFLDVDEPENYLHLDAVFVETGETLIPYFIEDLRLKGNKATVRFADVSADDVLKMVGKKLYLPLALLPPLSGNKFYYHEVVNFNVIDEKEGDIGFIETVLDFPAQALFQIKHDEKEILLPVIDSVIKKVDREHKTVFVKAPEGLINLYLN